MSILTFTSHPRKDSTTTSTNDLAPDLLRGAAEIAKFSFGKADAKGIKRVYDWAYAGKLPTFKIGNTLCARRSTLLRHIDRLEAGSVVERETAS